MHTIYITVTNGRLKIRQKFHLSESIMLLEGDDKE